MSERNESPWTFSTIGTELNLVNGFGFKPHQWKESGTPIVRIQNLNNQEAVFDYVQHTVDQRFHVKNGDLLFAWSGSRGTSFGPFMWYRGDAVLNQHIFNVRSKSPANLISYTYWWLKFLVGEIEQQAHGSAGLVHITRKELEKFRFPILDQPQQRKIARILTTVDNLIEKTEALIAKYQAIKQGMMHDLFTRGVDSRGHLRPPYEQAPELYKQSELGWIPKEWEQGKLEDYCDIHNHLRFPISSEQREHMQGDFPYYGPTGVFDSLDHYRVEGEYALIGEDGDHFLKYSIQPMTILANGRFNVNNHAHLLKGKNGCSTQWVFTYFCHRDIKNHLTHQGAGRLKLNKAALRAMILVVPNSSEQQLICDRFYSLNSRAYTERVQVEKLKRIKTGLMQDLLTGKVRVQVDEAEDVAAHA